MLTIPAPMLDRISKELLTLPAICGKVTLVVTFNLNASKTIGSMKINKSFEEEIRP